MPMNIIHVNQVRKQYQNHLALNDVSFDIEKGSIFGLLGPNGAGKTTFIRILTMITAPDSGYILFNNEKLDSHNIADIGYLPEERGLYKKMKVGEQALYLARLKGLDRDTAMTELKKWFIKFDITSWWDKKVEELSKGMAQKIQFITTIIHHPKVLIFDEPFSGFDPVNASILKQEIINQRNNGATIVFSTHNMESVEELCDSIVLINNANIVLDGKVKDIKQRFGTSLYNFDIEMFDDYNQSIVEEMKHKVDDCLIKDGHLSGKISLDKYLGESYSNVSDKHLKAETTNMIVNDLIKIGNIVTFNEVLPTMNDIFIKTVTANKEEK